MTQRFIKVSLLACMLCISGWLIAAQNVKKPAPDFVLKSNSGENVRLSELKGDVVLINFWATWCGPCRQEMPLLNDIYERYADLGFTMLGINVEKDSDQALRFLKDTPVSFPILFDTKNAIAKQFEVEAMPTTVIVDRNGDIRHLHYGYKKGYENKYREQVRALLKEK